MGGTFDVEWSALTNVRGSGLADRGQCFAAEKKPEAASASGLAFLNCHIID